MAFTIYYLSNTHPNSKNSRLIFSRTIHENFNQTLAHAHFTLSTHRERATQWNFLAAACKQHPKLALGQMKREAPRDGVKINGGVCPANFPVKIIARQIKNPRESYFPRTPSTCIKHSLVPASEAEPAWKRHRFSLADFSQIRVRVLRINTRTRRSKGEVLIIDRDRLRSLPWSPRPHKETRHLAYTFVWRLCTFSAGRRNMVYLFYSLDTGSSHSSKRWWPSMGVYKRGSVQSGIDGIGGCSARRGAAAAGCLCFTLYFYLSLWKTEFMAAAVADFSWKRKSAEGTPLHACAKWYPVISWVKSLLLSRLSFVSLTVRRGFRGTDRLGFRRCTIFHDFCIFSPRFLYLLG